MLLEKERMKLYVLNRLLNHHQITPPVRQYEELQRQDRSYQQLLHDDNTVDAEITVYNEYESVDTQQTLLPSTKSITYDIGPPPSQTAPPPPPPLLHTAS